MQNKEGNVYFNLSGRNMDFTLFFLYIYEDIENKYANSIIFKPYKLQLVLAWAWQNMYVIRLHIHTNFKTN